MGQGNILGTTHRTKMETNANNWSNKHFEFFKDLDAKLLEDELILEEEKKWLTDEEVAIEGFKRVFDS